jgi:outer membrane protein OmpA-like peptidoglycan-associated protein
MGISRLRALALIALLGPLSALAQNEPNARGFDLVPFKITPSWGSGLIVDSAELPRKGAWALRAHLDFNIGIMGLRISNEDLGFLVPFRTTLNLMGSYQIHKYIEIAADLPISIQATNFKLLRDQGFACSNPGDFNGCTAGDPPAVGFNDLRLQGRFRLLSQENFILGVAAIAEVRLPIGSEMGFMGDRGLVFAPRVAVERSIGPVKLYGNVGWRLRTAPGQYLNLYVGQEFIFGAGGQIKIPDIKTLTNNRILVDVNTSTPAEAPFSFQYGDSLKTPLEIMIGARSVVKEHYGVFLAVGTGIGARHGYGREILRINLAFSYEYEPELDTDGDGIPDRIDKCPTEPEDFDGDEDEDGCPEPDKDADGDGIPDKADGCKDQPGPKEYEGCPDRDGDQIPDNVDKCPDEPGPAETEGCPVPKEEQVVLESDNIRIKGNILYETGKAIIQKQSYPLLDDVAKVLRDNPDVGPVLVEGHTDNVGSRPYNLDLSNRRAQSVVDYLVSKGVKRERLRAAGYGFDRPVSTNDTPLGRAKNRRTAFRLINEDADAPDTHKTDPGAAPAPAPAPQK